MYLAGRSSRRRPVAWARSAGSPARTGRRPTAARARQHCRVAARVAARGRISRMRTRQRLRALAAHLAPARSGPADGHSEEESLSLPLSFPPPPSLSHTAASTEEIYRAPMTPASLGGALQPLRDSSALLDDTAALRFAHFVVSPTHSPIQTGAALLCSGRGWLRTATCSSRDSTAALR